MTTHFKVASQKEAVERNKRIWNEIPNKIITRFNNGDTLPYETVDTSFVLVSKYKDKIIVLEKAYNVEREFHNEDEFFSYLTKFF